MRQRSLTQRVFTALFGIWFSLLVAEPMPVHECPMHDGPLAQVAAMQTAALSDGVASSPGEVAAHHASQAHEQSAPSIPAEHGDHQCQCLGCCAGTSALSLPAAPVSNLCTALTPMQGPGIVADNVLQIATRFAFALPFANGPPHKTSVSA